MKPETNLKAYYRFENELSDSSGNHPSLSIHGGEAQYKAGAFGIGNEPIGAHSKWRISVAVDSGASSWKVRDIRWYHGWKQENRVKANLISSITASDGSSTAELVDGDAFTTYESDGNTDDTDKSIVYEFTEPLSVSRITVLTATAPENAVKRFLVEYYDVSSTSWTFAFEIYGLDAAGSIISGYGKFQTVGIALVLISFTSTK